MARRPYNYIELPIDIHQTATEMGIVLKPVSQFKHVLRVSKITSADKTSWQIEHRPLHKSNKKLRFAIAHGIAHVMLEQEVIEDASIFEFRDISDNEVIINNMALDLLIPPIYLNYLYNELDVIHRGELSRVFNVEEIEMHFQLIQHNLKIRL